MNVISKEKKAEVLQYMQDNPNVLKKDVAKLFGVNRMTVRAWAAGGWPKGRRDKLAAAQREQIKKHKFILVQFLGGQCSECGYRDCLAAIEFHHKNPAKKNINVSRLLAGKFEVALKEAKKCVLLCGNCHQKFHEQENDLSEIHSSFSDNCGGVGGKTGEGPGLQIQGLNPS